MTIRENMLIEIRDRPFKYIISKVYWDSHHVEIMRYNPVKPHFPSSKRENIHFENIEGIVTQTRAGKEHPPVPEIVDEAFPGQIVTLYGDMRDYVVLERKGEKTVKLAPVVYTSQTKKNARICDNKTFTTPIREIMEVNQYRDLFHKVMEIDA